MKWKEDQKNILVPVDKIKENIKNPRKGTYDKVDMEELKDSIQSLGQLTPLKLDETGTLLAGHRRLKALKELGKEKARCDVITGLSVFKKSAILISDNATQRKFSAWDNRIAISDIYWNEFCEEYHFKTPNDKGYSEFAKQLGVSATQVRTIIESMSRENTEIYKKLKNAGLGVEVFDTILHTSKKYRKKVLAKALELNKKNGSAGLGEKLRMYKKSLLAKDIENDLHPAYFKSINYKIEAIGHALTKDVISKTPINNKLELKQNIEKYILPVYNKLKKLKGRVE